MNQSTRGEFQGDTTDEAVLASMEERIKVLGLDLTGLNVVTEAATGAYACTPVIAAMANAAHVHAVSRDTAHYGSFEDAREASLSLARRVGVADRITVARDLPDAVLSSCDILTNSGHLRPITDRMIRTLPSSAVIALMFEAWEFRAPDLDLAACAVCGVRVAAVNERHPDVDVFAFLGPLCVQLLNDAGFEPLRRKVALICDNPFRPFMMAGLEAAGARPMAFGSLSEVSDAGWDAVILALNPAWNAPVKAETLDRLARHAPGALLAQFWGDLDLRPGDWPGPVWPPRRPGRGHMAILLNRLGPEPVIRLQAGGLRAAELIFKGHDPGGVAELLRHSNGTPSAATD